MNFPNLLRHGILPHESHIYKWMILMLAMLGTFIAVLDITIVNVALPTIMHDFGKTLAEGEWLSTAYLASNVLFLPITAWLARKFGFKLMLFLGVAIFTAGSWWCMLSGSLEMLLIGRIVEGIGSGMIMPLGMAIVTREFSAVQRPLALGFWAMSTAASVSLGPILGGYLVDGHGWQSIFAVNIPIGVLTLVAIALLQREWRDNETGRFDIRGFVYMLMWLPTGLLTLSMANTLPIFAVIGLTLIVVTFFTLFVQHSLSEKSPMLDLKLFRERSFRNSMLIMVLFGFGIFGGNFILPLFVQQSLDYTALQAGMIFLPVGIIQGIMGPLSGFLSRRLGNRTLLLGGLLFFISYLGVSSFFDADSSQCVIQLSLYLRGLGLGLAFTSLNAISFENLEPSQMADASAISNTIRQLSGSIAIAFLSLVLTSEHTATQYIVGVDVDFRTIFVVSVLTLIPLFFLVGRTILKK